MTYRPNRDASPEIRVAEALDHIAIIVDEWAQREGLGVYE